MHALGLTIEPPLHSAVAAMGVDASGRDDVIAALQLLVPNNGEFIAKIGGKPLRVWRDAEGKAHAAEYIEPKAAPAEKTGRGLKTSATILSVVPKDHVKAAADAAERRSAAKSDRRSTTTKPPMTTRRSRPNDGGIAHIGRGRGRRLRTVDIARSHRHAVAAHLAVGARRRLVPGRRRRLRLALGEHVERQLGLAHALAALRQAQYRAGARHGAHASRDHDARDPRSDRFMRTHHVDHGNGQSLDNRRDNLSWVTNRQNAANRRPRAKIPSLDSIVRQLVAGLGALPESPEVPF